MSNTARAHFIYNIYINLSIIQHFYYELLFNRSLEVHEVIYLRYYYK